MSEHLEIEYKMLLNKEQYDKILKDIKANAKEIVQTNVYFDNENYDLANSLRSIRVRIGGAKGYELTMKSKQDDHQQLEKNFVIEDSDYFDIVENPNQYLYEFFEDLPKDLRPLGILKTTRYEWESAQGTYMLDASFYHNVEDYEIEFEAKEANQEQVLADFLKQYDIVYQANDKTKIQRFMETKELEPLSSVKAFLYQSARGYK